MTDADVVVIGAGVAGLAAAIAAQREGATVAIVDGGAGATSLAGGAWDLPHAGEASAAPRSLADALDALARRAPRHPLARLPRGATLAAMRDVQRELFAALGMARRSDDLADACLVATELGVLRRATGVERAVLDLASLHGARVAVAGMPGLRSFDARFVAASLGEQAVRAGDARRFVAIEVELFRRAGDTSLLPHESAALLDQVDARRLACVALQRALGGASFDAVLLPPVLGLENDRVAAELEAAVGVPCGEVVSALAGPQALRLARRIAAALEGAAISRSEARAERLAVHDEGVEVELAGGGELRARAVVLATGKHVGGGIESSARRLREPLLDLAIWSAGRPLVADAVDVVALYGDDFFAPGSGFSAGVGHNDELRPLDARGEPVSRALFACGALLEGATDGDGLGAAATTGWLAGTHAARFAAR